MQRRVIFVPRRRRHHQTFGYNGLPGRAPICVISLAFLLFGLCYSLMMIVEAHSCGSTLRLACCNVKRGTAFKLGIERVLLPLIALASLLGLIDFHLSAIIVI